MPPHRNPGALLLLADGRLPSGGYAHSAGLEAAVRLGRVRDTDDLERFLVGLATTTGRVAATFAAAACATAARGDLDGLDRLQSEFAARTPSPAQRRVASALGRQLLRALSSIAPHELHGRIPDRLYHPVAFGVGAATLGLAPGDASRAMLHETLMTPTIAAPKLLRIDPFDAHRAFAATLAVADSAAVGAARDATRDPATFPAWSAPLAEVYAAQHAAARTRLFAS